MNRKSLSLISSVLCLPILLAGCSAGYYRRSADKEVYGIIGQKEKKVLGRETGFTISPKGLPEEWHGKLPATLDLQKTLVLAARQNRDYQTQKENLYLQTLTLTQERHNYRPRLNAGGQANWLWEGKETEFSSSADLGLVQWLADGARITLDLTTDFLRYLTGDPRKELGSALTLNIFQPLFRGAGRRIAQEGLTQAERDVIYQIRSFLRYQRSFSVSIAEQYYQLLEQRTVLSNEESNYQRLVLNRERAQALGDAGRLPLMEVDQARQQELSAYDRVGIARKVYQEAFDRFKIQLGLPPGTEIAMPEDEATRLLEKDLPVTKIGLDDAMKIALEKRFDLITSFDSLADAQRKIAVSQSNLRTGLDFSGAGVLTTPSDRETASKFDRGNYSAGVNLDLPTDRLSERNTYRQTLISFDRSQRDYSLLKDTITLQVRAALRTLEQAQQSYRNQKTSVALARRRVENTNLLLEAGRASQRDILESQSSLLQAQNDLVAAAVNYLSAYMEFLRDTETLPLSEEGVWNGELI